MSANAKLLRYLAQLLGLALSYLVVALLSLKLAIPPGYATPLFPAAGLALAALLGMGPRFAPAILLGSFAVNLFVGFDQGAPSFLAALLTGTGSTLQALFGTWAIRRWVSRPLLLSEPRDLALFFGLGAGLACLISPSFGTAGLLAAGIIAKQQLAGTWAAWWLGDTMGVLIGAPIALTLLGRPRRVWVKRRLSLGLPMLFTTALVTLAIVGVSDWEQQRARSVFERDAANAANALELLLREPLMALQGSQGLMVVAPTLSRDEFRQATRNFLPAGGPLMALGMARRVSRSQLPAFDAAAREEGLTDYHARDRTLPGDRVTAPDEDMLAIRLIEPMAGNARALGVNIRSVTGSRAAIARSVQTGQASATAGIQLSQAAANTTGVVVYQALYRGDPVTVAEREAALQGAVFATLRPDLLAQRVLAAVPGYLHICLVDVEPGAARRRLAGDPGCESLGGSVALKARRIAFGGRNWDIRIYAPQGIPLDDARSWPFALGGLVSTGLLGVLLLMVTGRAQRIEELVHARTAELKREVAEREQSTLALSVSEARFRNIFEHAPIGIVFANAYGSIKDVNPHFCRMVGYTAEQLKQMRSFDVTHPDDCAEDERMARQLIANKIGQYRLNKRYVTSQGEIVQARVLVSAQRNSAGTVYRLVGVVEDIADQLKMQELARTAHAAAAANQAKNEFLSRMSHELRTPLNAMLGFTQLLDIDSTAPLTPRQRARTAQIQQAGWHLLDMINDTLDLSRIESGALKLETVQLSIAQLLDEAQALVEADAAARQVLITRELGTEALYARGDVTRLKQVLTNLLSNAVKYNVDGGTIVMRSQRADPGRGFVELSIEDSGLGLAPEQLEALFQPFNRLGREHGNTTGTGIGLVIAKRLAELMGGSLTATSRAGKGSTFILRLPAADDAAPPSSPDHAAVAPVATGPTGRRRLAYIEDNPMNAELMRGALEQRPLIDLQVFTTGRAGLEAMLAEPPDLLLLDMQLPDIDGLSVLKRLRQRWSEEELPIVVVSANALQAQIDASTAAGAQQYLTKPLDVRTLLALLDRMMEGSVN